MGRKMDKPRIEKTSDTMGTTCPLHVLAVLLEASASLSRVYAGAPKRAAKRAAPMKKPAAAMEAVFP